MNRNYTIILKAGQPTSPLDQALQPVVEGLVGDLEGLLASLAQWHNLVDTVLICDFDALLLRARGHAGRIGSSLTLG